MHTIFDVMEFLCIYYGFCCEINIVITTNLVVPLKLILTPSLYQENTISGDPYAIHVNINSDPSHTSGRWFTTNACKVIYYFIIVKLI